MGIQINKSIPPDNFITFHHTNTTIIIPVDPETLQDAQGASFASSTPLSRSAPIFSYQNSGPRSVQVGFTLHRDLCREFNPGEEDAVDQLITNLDQMVLPDYESSGKIVNPPVVSLKIRDEIFIKGIVRNASHSFSLPIIKYEDGFKYAVVSVQFSIEEVTPYSASILPNVGQFRNKLG